MAVKYHEMDYAVLWNHNMSTLSTVHALTKKETGLCLDREDFVDLVSKGHKYTTLPLMQVYDVTVGTGDRACVVFTGVADLTRPMIRNHNIFSIKVVGGQAVPVQLVVPMSELWLSATQMCMLNLGGVSSTLTPLPLTPPRPLRSTSPLHSLFARDAVLFKNALSFMILFLMVLC